MVRHRRRRRGRRGMRAPRVIPDIVRQRQSEASDPNFSAFVAANAGSGKTHVLAQRVIRLLLNGVNPAKILCITFTKAAAANMANRVFDELRKWTALDDAALDKAIKTIGARAIDAELRACAKAVCPRARNTGRAEGADDSRFLYALAACLPV